MASEAGVANVRRLWSWSGHREVVLGVPVVIALTIGTDLLASTL
jgi:hypothetical protein